MTVLLQTRVEDRVAEDFKRAAKSRGKTPGAYLQQLIEQAVVARKTRTGNSRKRTVRRKVRRLPYNLVARLRDDDGE